MVLGLLTLVGGALVSAMGCSHQGDGGEDTGAAQIAISQVPSDGSVGCIAVTATGDHTVTRSFDVVPGQSTVFDIHGLPVGTVSFLGNAYQGACAAVTPASSPTWISDAVLASVSNVQPVMVQLTLHRNGKAGVDVDFEDEPSCRAAGAPCLGNAECCSQSCVAGACEEVPLVCPWWLVSCNGACVDSLNDPLNCGACGNPCLGGDFCLLGVCVAATCVDGTLNGAETDVDCGGSCALCGLGNACQIGADCASTYCLGGVCAPAPCQTATDCPGTDGDCQMRACNAGLCGTAYAPAGTPLSTQTPGDCHVTVCDGWGSHSMAVDDADVLDDGSPCTVEMCWMGSLLWMPATGTACNENGGTVCDVNGDCVPSLP
ncbi:Tryptophan synthase alpha chain [Minicystis rosea]|nr:Tryptophan synthase alpha chain [Minicystis rosea]